MEKQEKLLVLWTSPDREVALKMVFMYAFNSKLNGWWDDVCLIVWGPSAQLLAQDEELQDHVRKMMEKGVEVVACKACADSYSVSERLATMGIDVKYMGKPLTEMLKSGWTQITI
jgi:hypothetical protein